MKRIKLNRTRTIIETCVIEVPDDYDVYHDLETEDRIDPVFGNPEAWTITHQGDVCENFFVELNVDPEVKPNCRLTEDELIHISYPK